MKKLFLLLLLIPIAYVADAQVHVFRVTQRIFQTLENNEWVETSSQDVDFLGKHDMDLRTITIYAKEQMTFFYKMTEEYECPSFSEYMMEALDNTGHELVIGFTIYTDPTISTKLDLYNGTERIRLYLTYQQ